MALITVGLAAKELRVSRTAVYNAVKTGRLTCTEAADGTLLVDSETMRSEWDAKTQRRIGRGIHQQTRSREQKPLRPREIRMGLATPEISATKEAIPDYDDSRARTEHLKAELLELDRQQKLGRLVPVEDVEKRWVEIIVQARTKLLGLPTKAKQRIPDLDVDAIGTLDEIVRETLEELAAQGDEDSEEEVSQ